MAEMSKPNDGSPLDGDAADSELLSQLNRYYRDVRNYLPAIIVPALMQLLGISIYTHIFAPDEYGQYSLVVAAAGIATIVVGGWIWQSTLRFLPRYTANNGISDFTGGLFIVNIVSVVGFFGTGVLIYALLNESLLGYKRFYFPALLLVILESLFINLSTVFQASLQSKRYAIYRSLLAIGQTSAALIIVLLISKDVLGLILGSIASYLVLTLHIIRELKPFGSIGSLSIKFDFSLFKKFVVYGFPMTGYLIGSNVLSISDRFIIGGYRNSAEVGIYSSSYNLIYGVIGLITAPMLMAAHPLIMNAWENGRKDQIERIISLFSRYFLLATIPLVFYLAFFGRDFISIFLGAKFREGYLIAPIVVTGFLSWNFAMYGHKGLEIMEKTKVIMISVLVCALANIAVNLVFVPRYGYIVAAISTLGAYLLYALIIYFVTRRYIRWHIPWPSVARIALSSLVAMGSLAVIRHQLISGSLGLGLLALLSALSLLSYLGLLYLLGEWHDFEKDYFEKMVIGRLKAL